MILVWSPWWINSFHPPLFVPSFRFPTQWHENSIVLVQLPFLAVLCIGRTMTTFRNNGKLSSLMIVFWEEIEESQYDWESKGWCHLLGQIYSCARGKLLEMEYGFLKLDYHVINETRPRGPIYRILYKRKYPNL